MKRPLLVLCIAVFVLALFASLPFLLWHLQGETPLSLLIVDKTVPVRDFREHKGLVWILNHYRFVRAENGKPFSPEEDYAGFVPLPDGRYRIRPLPPLPARRFDLIYLADTYGVYKADFLRENRPGARSELIYGGLQPDEVRLVERARQQGSWVIAEFNSFASPTGGEARRAITTLLGVRWNGWMGRRFTELKKDVEVPEWAVRGYRQQYGREWNFTGSGFIFVHEDGRLLVLRDREEVGPDRLRIVIPEQVARQWGVPASVPYGYWFDIVAPREGAEVVGEYRFDATPAGRELLARAGIPLVFPAIVRQRGETGGTYYFAGDFVDQQRVPLFFRLRGTPVLRSLFTVTDNESTSFFYWKLYVPMMKAILDDIARQRPR